MSNLYWLTDAQTERLKPFFPKSHGKPSVDGRRVLSGIVFINRMGLRWCDAPKEYGPAKTLYNRWKRWSDNGVFARIMVGLATERAEHKTTMIDATYLKAHRTASSLRVKKGGRERQIGRTKGGMNTKLHAVADANRRPIGFFMSAGQVSDYTGAAALLASLLKAGWLLADRGYDADWFRDALKDKGIEVCIPGRKSRKKSVKYDKRRYKRRNRIEIMFGRLGIVAKVIGSRDSRSESSGLISSYEQARSHPLSHDELESVHPHPQEWATMARGLPCRSRTPRNPACDPTPGPNYLEALERLSHPKPDQGEDAMLEGFWREGRIT